MTVGTPRQVRCPVALAPSQRATGSTAILAVDDRLRARQPQRHPTRLGRRLYAFMRRILASERGGELYAQRQALIEPAFANTKFNRGIDRFERRGRAAVRTEWRLITATHNLLKHTDTPPRPPEPSPCPRPCGPLGPVRSPGGKIGNRRAVRDRDGRCRGRGRRSGLPPPLLGATGGQCRHRPGVRGVLLQVLSSRLGVGANSVVRFGEALGGWLSGECSLPAVEVVVGQPGL
jgi:DDE family transposase